MGVCGEECEVVNVDVCVRRRTTHVCVSDMQVCVRVKNMLVC